MDAGHKLALTKNNVLLVEEMMVDDTFLSHFQEDGVLIDSHIEAILAKSTKNERAGEFLRTLRRRGPLAMLTFITALVKTHQDHIADMVEPGLAAHARKTLGAPQPHTRPTYIAQESTGPADDDPEPNLNEEEMDDCIMPEPASPLFSSSSSPLCSVVVRTPPPPSREFHTPPRQQASSNCTTPGSDWDFTPKEEKKALEENT